MGIDRFVLTNALCRFTRETSSEVDHLRELFGRTQAYGTEEATFLLSLPKAGKNGAADHAKLFAASLYVAAYHDGMSAAYAKQNVAQSRQKRGAR